MNKLLLLLLLVLITTITLKTRESLITRGSMITGEPLIVNFKCNKKNGLYLCKEKDDYFSIIENTNSILNNYKELAQNNYNEFKKLHEKEQKEFENTFGKIKV